jgi:succinate dehydrogenase / fumarate reductase, cytochrome b subunit
MSVYQMHRYTLISSIVHRGAGLALALGLVLLVAWLMAVAMGREAYGQVLPLFGSLPAKLVYLGLIAAFSYHLIAGIRHLIWDTGTGLERAQVKRSAALVWIAAVLLSLALAWALLAGRLPLALGGLQ